MCIDQEHSFLQFSKDNAHFLPNKMAATKKMVFNELSTKTTQPKCAKLSAFVDKEWGYHSQLILAREVVYLQR